MCKARETPLKKGQLYWDPRKIIEIKQVKVSGKGEHAKQKCRVC